MHVDLYYTPLASNAKLPIKVLEAIDINYDYAVTLNDSMTLNFPSFLICDSMRHPKAFSSGFSLSIAQNA